MASLTFADSPANGKLSPFDDSLNGFNRGPCGLALLGDGDDEPGDESADFASGEATLRNESKLRCLTIFLSLFIWFELPLLKSVLLDMSVVDPCRLPSSVLVAS
jgi:hypothetical protein